MLRKSVTPRMVSHSAVISACEKGKHWEEALRLGQEMLQRSLTPDVVSNNAAIGACEKGTHWEQTLRLLQMHHRLLTHNAVSHNLAISACEKGKHWEEALRLLQEMLHRSLTAQPSAHARRASTGQKHFACCRKCSTDRSRPTW